jgi:hypothetical protein
MHQCAKGLTTKKSVELSSLFLVKKGYQQFVVLQAELIGCVQLIIIGTVEKIHAVINKCLGSVVGC